MPKKMSDRDRLLAFAFRATAEELEDAIGVFKAALRAKPSAGTPRTRKPKQPEVKDAADTQ